MAARSKLQSRRLRSAMSFVVAALMIGSVSYLGVRTYQDSHAATPGSLYLNPSSATVKPGESLSVTIRENSGSEPVNSVQASLKYDAAKLQYTSITEGGAFSIRAASNAETPGVVRVARANAGAEISGDQPVVTVNFKVIATSGSDTLSFDTGYSFLVRSSDSKDILNNTGSSTYSISAGEAASSTSTKPIMYITPASGTYATGSTVTADVKLNSYATPMTVVEAVIGYPTDQLQYEGVEEGGVFTNKQRTNAANGIVNVIRSVAGGSSGVTGDNTVFKLKFKVIGRGPSAGLVIGGNSAAYAYDKAGSATNILNTASSSGAAYTIPSTGNGPISAGVGSQDDSTGSKAATTITSPSQAITVGAQSGGSVSIAKDAKGSAVTQVSGQVSLSPVIDQSLLAATPGESIKKVEYILDGKLLASVDQAPYAYKLDTPTLKNGTYTMVVKTFYGSGTVDTRTDKIMVNNKVTLSYVMRHYLINIVATIIMLALLVLLLIKLVIPRIMRRPAFASAGPTDFDTAYRTQSSGAGLTAGDPTVITPLAIGGQAPANGATSTTGAFAPTQPIQIVDGNLTVLSSEQAEGKDVPGTESLPDPALQPLPTDPVTAPSQPNMVSQNPVQPESALVPPAAAPASAPAPAPVPLPSQQIPTSLPTQSTPLAGEQPRRFVAPPPTNRFQ